MQRTRAKRASTAAVAVVAAVAVMAAAVVVLPAVSRGAAAVAQELVAQELVTQELTGAGPSGFLAELDAGPQALPPVTATRQQLLAELLRRSLQLQQGQEVQDVQEGSAARLRTVSVPADLPGGEQPGAPPEPSTTASPTAPEATQAPATLVRARQPRLHLDAPATQVAALAASLRALPEVGAAADVVRGTLPVSGVSGPEALTVAAVDPGAFRALTPQTTADATALWDRLREGDAVFTHETGARLGLELATTVVAADSELRVGGFAATGAPSVADLVVSRETAAVLGLEGQGSVLGAPADGVSAEALAAAVAAASGLQPVAVGQPQSRRAFLAGDDTRRAFEPFTYSDHGDGLITIDAAWVQAHIVSARVPLLTGPVRCHRLLIEQLRGALAELEAAGLGDLIDPRQYGGCHVARHIDFNPSLPLSMHAWGLAVDLNVSTNGLGRAPTMDPRVVEVFERWGFAWGGRWSRPDGMHFELAALLEPAEG